MLMCVCVCVSEILLHIQVILILNCVSLWWTHVWYAATISLACCLYNLRLLSIGFYQPALLTKELQQHRPVSGTASSGLDAGFFLAQNRALVVDHPCGSVRGA